MESSSTVINMPIVARFADAAVSKFVVKVNNFGMSEARIEFKIESENPEADFAEILALQKFRVSLTIRERSHDRRLPSTVKE